MTCNRNECYDTYVKDLEKQIMLYKNFEQRVMALVEEAENNEL